VEALPAGGLTALVTGPDMTAPGVVVGTIWYMSPEQVNGSPADHRSDIFAFGAVLYELLSGRRAFQGASWVETMTAILNDAPPEIAASGERQIPPALERIVGRCLEKAPAQRFQSAKDLSFALQQISGAAPLLGQTARVSTFVGYAFALSLVAVTITVLFLAVRWLRPADSNGPYRWTGTLLNGPEIAFSPRISPDGRMVAFQALINGQTEVALMNPTSGDWTLLTRDTAVGIITQTSWSKDGARIYFDRHTHTAVGVFSVSALGGEPRLILENAGAPEPLPDGDLLVTRKSDERWMQLHRYRSATSQLEPLNALVAEVGGDIYRVSSDGNWVAFYGKPANQPDGPTKLHVLHLRSGETRRISDTTMGFVFDVRDGSLLFARPKGDGYEIVSRAPDSDTYTRALLTLTDAPWALDIAPDGSLYVGTVVRPFQVVRFSESGVPTAGLTVAGADSVSSALELPDGRFLVTGKFDGRYRLLAAKPTGEFARFVETEEETRDPAALIGDRDVAFLIGKAAHTSLAIASIKSGRIAKRLKTESTDPISSLSASSDGFTLFYSAGGSIWSIPTTGSDPAKKLGAGDGVVFDPRHRDLVVQLNEKDGVRFVRMATSTGSTAPILVKEPLQIAVAGVPVFGSAAVRADGRIVFSSISPDNPWFLTVSILDPQTGSVHTIPSQYEGDVFGPSWNSRDEIVAGGLLVRGSIWRFRPDTESADSRR
jgi:hypothetical protein